MWWLVVKTFQMRLLGDVVCRVVVTTMIAVMMDMTATIMARVKAKVFHRVISSEQLLRQPIK